MKKSKFSGHHFINILKNMNLGKQQSIHFLRKSETYINIVVKCRKTKTGSIQNFTLLIFFLSKIKEKLSMRFAVLVASASSLFIN